MAGLLTTQALKRAAALEEHARVVAWAPLIIGAAEALKEALMRKAYQEAAAAVFGALFGNGSDRDRYGRLSSETLNQIGDIVSERLDRNQATLINDWMLGIGREFSEFLLSPASRSGALDLLRHRLGVDIIPTCLRLSPQTTGVYAQAVVTKLAISAYLIPSFPSERVAAAEAARVAIEDLTRLRDETHSKASGRWTLDVRNAPITIACPAPDDGAEAEESLAVRPVILRCTEPNWNATIRFDGVQKDITNGPDERSARGNGEVRLAARRDPWVAENVQPLIDGINRINAEFSVIQAGVP
jgi:hypothetical protein